MSDQEMNAPDVESPKAGWGGARKGAGGARKGAGRPKKPKLPPVRPVPSELQPRFDGPAGCGFYVRGTGYCVNGSPVVARKLVTTGRIMSAIETFVYVGVSRSGIIKIGMSGNPSNRCKGLGITLLFTVPVVPGAVKLVETYALQELGAKVGDSEWVECTPEQAIDAVCVAWQAASKVAHVNPLITEDDARALRVRMAA